MRDERYRPAGIEEIADSVSLLNEPLPPDNVGVLVPSQQRSLHLHGWRLGCVLPTAGEPLSASFMCSVGALAQWDCKSRFTMQTRAIEVTAVSNKRLALNWSASTIRFFVTFGFEDRVPMKKGGLYKHFCQSWLQKNNLRQPN
jgi:hypothetical protein